jgi:hypothetical protein
MRALLCVLCLFLAAGCRRTPSGPDANYEKASKLYQQLYATQLDDAYGDPKMDQVVGMLKLVDRHSSDAEAAQTMLRAIDHGREELARSRAAREKMGAAAAASARNATSFDPTAVLAASAPDAGPPRDPYAAGRLVAEINAETGGCLVDGEPFKEQGTGMSGTSYRLSRAPACLEKLPGFAGQLILVVEGRIYRRVADPGPLAPQAIAIGIDAGPPAPAPAPPAPAAAPPAAEEPRFLYPGQPQGPAPDAGP